MPWGVAAAAVGGLIASEGASDAADTQVAGTDRASQLQRQTAQDQMALSREQFAAQQALIRDQMSRDYQIYETARDDSRLGREVGQNALRQLSSDVTGGGFQYNPNAFKNMEMDPGWQFRQQTGESALRRQLNAGNGVYSGAAAKALLGYNSNLASQEYGAAYGRAADAEARRKDQYQLRTNQLATLAGIGQTANNSSQVAGQAFSGAGQNATAQMGQAGAMNASNAINALGGMAQGVGSNIIGAANAQAGNSMYQGNTWANAVNQGASAWGRNSGGGGGTDYGNLLHGWAGTGGAGSSGGYGSVQGNSDYQWDL
jgi:hypothetical protein